MRVIKVSLCLFLLLGVSCTTTAPKRVADQDLPLAALTSSKFERFASEAAFLDYVRAVRKVARDRGIWWAHGDGPEYAEAKEVPCPPGVTPPCYGQSDSEQVVVTGARIASPAAASITNVQMLGVDEGDIVKQFGNFLIVLQDGRLFSVDTRPENRAGLALVDRANVYRHSDEDTWYDEMLVHEHRIVVTGYSYLHEAAEFSVFTISDAGRFTREATYYISSQDYYSAENYATRLVDGKLVIRSALDLTYLNPDRPIEWPLMRRWLREGKDDRALSAGVRVFDAKDIYRPIQSTTQPAIHSISVCDLGTTRPGDELACRTTAFVAPFNNTYFVSKSDAYLWIAPGYDERADLRAGPACDPKHGADFASGVPAILFQVPLGGDEPRFLDVRGEPWDHFGLDADARDFRALLVWNASCESDPPLEVKYFRAKLRDFGRATQSVREQDYTSLPSPDAHALENRFTDHMLVYSGRLRWGSSPPEENEGPLTSLAVAVPLAQPQNATVVKMPHNVIRVERVGDNAVLTGYRDSKGLSISLLDLREKPQLASTAILARRYESEGRSHAFNAAIEEDDSGIMGVPTVKWVNEGGRWVWRSEASDVSFLSVGTEGKLASLGSLDAHENAQDQSYKCEVSCVDWYGNTRPIFIDNRIFALSATELIEGKIARNTIHETRRVNLTAPIRK